MLFRRAARLALIAVCIAVSPARADHRDDDQGLFASAAADFFSSYYFRGVRYSDRPSLQPSLQLNYQNRVIGGVGAGVWAHLPIGDRSDRFHEIDYDLHYDVGAGPLVFSIGQLWYTSAGTSSNARFHATTESYLSVLLDAYLEPSFVAYHDEDRFRDWYYELGLRQPIPERVVGEQVEFTPAVVWGFSGSSDGRFEGRGLVATTISLEADLARGYCRFGPALSYTHASDDAASSGIWGGVRISCEGRVLAPPPRPAAGGR